MAPVRRRAAAGAPTLPLSNVSRIVKQALPAETSVSKDAREEIVAAASIFIHFITSGALDYCHARKKSTITPEDVLEAVRESEMHEFYEPLRQYMDEYKAQEGKKAHQKNAKQEEQVQESGEKESIEQASKSPRLSPPGDIEARQ